MVGAAAVYGRSGRTHPHRHAVQTTAVSTVSTSNGHVAFSTRHVWRVQTVRVWDHLFQFHGLGHVQRVPSVQQRGGRTCVGSLYTGHGHGVHLPDMQADSRGHFQHLRGNFQRLYGDRTVHRNPRRPKTTLGGVAVRTGRPACSNLRVCLGTLLQKKNREQRAPYTAYITTIAHILHKRHAGDGLHSTTAQRHERTTRITTVTAPVTAPILQRMFKVLP